MTSDAIGNMLSDGTNTYTWKHGRQLDTMTNSGNYAEYVYGADGRRTSKIVNGQVHTFIWIGDKIVQENYAAVEKKFFYDAEGRPDHFTYNGELYYYVLNIMGDVTHILDGNGNLCGGYLYDAWGNTVLQWGSGVDLNPIRYRSYFYDGESGLYYVQSRYYDPEIGRFISPDNFVSTGQGFLGNNMFAYCNNNPVMYSDTNGEFPWLAVIVIAVCTIAGGTLGYMYDDKLGEQSLENENSRSIKPLPPNQINESFSNKSEQIDVPTQDNDSELSVGDRVKNTLVGAGLGLAVGGAVVATGGAAGSIAVGSATTYIALFGGTGAQTFAIGAVAYDLFALIIAPFFGIEMETIEIEP